MPILIADDDRISQRMIQGLLEKWGYKVTLATDGSEALSQLQSEDGPHLAILDWMMPSLSGPEICEQILLRPPRHPVYVILLTFRATADDIVAGLESGADDYLVKPCEPTELRARVRVGLRMIEAKAALLDKVDQMNRFLGMAAHDLRNPLSIVKGYSSFLSSETVGNLNPRQQQFLGAIQRSGDFMLRLVENLLETSSIQDGELTLNLEERDVIGLIQENLAMNRILAERKSLSLSFTCAEESLTLRVDADKLDQVMNNLISNATKYSEAETAIVVSLWKENGEAVIKVQDQGQGIPPGDLKRLFQPFARLSGHTTGGEKSTGLGLSIVKRIVEGHGGRIWVESQVGKGTTVQVALPLA